MKCCLDFHFNTYWLDHHGDHHAMTIDVLQSLIVMAFNKALEEFFTVLDFIISDSHIQTKSQKVFRFCSVILLVLAFILELADKYLVNIQDISTFLAILDSVGYEVSTTMNLCLVMKPKLFQNNLSYSHLDPRTKIIQLTDPAMYILTGFAMFHFYTSSSFLEQWLNLFIVNQAFETIFLFHCIALKYFLLKRMNALKESGTHEDILMNLRALLAETAESTRPTSYSLQDGCSGVSLYVFTRCLPIGSCTDFILSMIVTNSRVRS